MIDNPWVFLSIIVLVSALVLIAGERRPSRFFELIPPIVLLYLLVSVFAGLGVWHSDGEIARTQTLALDHLLPATLFLMLCQCNVRGIWRLGPRILGAFACATLSIMFAFVIVFILFKAWLGVEGWKLFSSLTGAWIGGAGNMIAVKEAVNLADGPFANALVTDALCYSVWVAFLFSAVPFAERFNRWTKASPLKDYIPIAEVQHSENTGASVLLWLGIALCIGELCRWLAQFFPVFSGISTNTWTILLATLLAIGASFTRLQRFAKTLPIASIMLALVVAIMASRSNFNALLQAPIFILCGFIVLALHGIILVLCAKLFRFDLSLISVASLSNVGGVASAPLIAAAHSPTLASVGVMLAMLGYVVGTIGGLTVAQILMRLAS